MYPSMGQVLVWVGVVVSSEGVGNGYALRDQDALVHLLSDGHDNVLSCLDTIISSGTMTATRGTRKNNCRLNISNVLCNSPYS